MRGRPTHEEAGVCGVVEFYAEESQIVLPRLLAAGRRFDLAFVDGNHRFEGVFLDLLYSGRLLKEAASSLLTTRSFPACGEPSTFASRTSAASSRTKARNVKPMSGWFLGRVQVKCSRGRSPSSSSSREEARNAGR